MKKIIIIIFILLSAVAMFASETDERRESAFKAAADSILLEYTDAEFKAAMLKTLQKSNATNMDMFIQELEVIRKGKDTATEKLTGIKNIKKEHKPGMDGWMVALSGILVVYIGLLVLALVVMIFNFFLKDKKSQVRKKEVKQAASAVIKPVPQEIPEDHIVALATAVELYYRLYLHGRPSGNAVSTQYSPSWKSGGNFGMRKNQR